MPNICRSSTSEVMRRSTRAPGTLDWAASGCRTAIPIGRTWPVAAAGCCSRSSVTRAELVETKRPRSSRCGSARGVAAGSVRPALAGAPLVPRSAIGRSTCTTTGAAPAGRSDGADVDGARAPSMRGEAPSDPSAMFGLGIAGLMPGVAVSPADTARPASDASDTPSGSTAGRAGPG